MRQALILAVLLSSQAAAQHADTPGLRDTDTGYTAPDLNALLSDHAVEFFDGSVSRYRGDGAYSYKYTESDRPWLGTWQVRAGGEICVAFDNGSSRCDTFVSDGTRMVLIIANGTRFPVRERRALVEGD